MESKLKRRNIPVLRDPLDVLSRCKVDYEVVETTYRTRLYKLLATAAHVAAEYIYDRKQFKKFAKHDFWKGAKHKPRPDSTKRSNRPMGFVIQFMMGASDKSELKLAWKYARALQFLLDQGTRIEDIPAALSAEGVEKLVRTAAKIDSRRTKKIGDPSYYDDVGIPEEVGLDGSPKPTKPKPVVKLKLNSNRRKRVASMKVGDEASLRVRRVDGAVGRVLLQVRRFKPLAAKS